MLIVLFCLSSLGFASMSKDPLANTETRVPVGLGDPGGKGNGNPLNVPRRKPLDRPGGLQSKISKSWAV